ncbi:MAG: patatin-like phospholipase family protein, partial [Saprospiraceae bacterium]
MSQTTPTLHLGITMAGAVSAGAYTAGVMDYLFEALQKWETAKKKEAKLSKKKKKIPPHCVQIDVIGGASAGGITAALTALTCFSGINPVTKLEPVKEKGDKPSNNLLFDTWVNLAGKKNMPEAIFRMLQTDDLDGMNGIPALLNSKAIDDVAANAVNHVKSMPQSTWPAFVADDLEILLTLCSLRGIPVGIDFNSGNNTWTTGPSHQMAIHKQYARFTTDENSVDTSRAMPVRLSIRETLENFIHFAKATAAFPIGLEARQISLSRNHIKHQFGTFFGFDQKTLDKVFEESTVSDPFEFTSVDGGALNNEPFSEIA